MLDIRPPLAPFAAAFARTATITPAGGVAITADVIWDQQADAPADMNMGASSSVATNRRLVAYVRRDQVPSLPVGSTILGGPQHQQKLWRVTAVEQSDPDYTIAVMG
jgi:hypothetical protein